jgi:hypothetical protein
MFLISYIAIAQLNMAHIRLGLLIIIYLSSILSAMIYFKLLHRVKKSTLHSLSLDKDNMSQTSSYKFDFALLDSAIMDGFEVITKVGGYIILFQFLHILFPALQLMEV